MFYLLLQATLAALGIGVLLTFFVVGVLWVAIQLNPEFGKKIQGAIKYF